jgi:hypothetical protein
MQFRSDIFWRAAKGCCPDCGAEIRSKKNPLSKWGQFANIPDRCPECGMVLRRRDGFFLGAIVWNYTLTAFGALPLLLIAVRLGWCGEAWAIRWAILTALTVPFFIHALSWRLWIGTYYAFLPEQLPSSGRRTDD